jgi:tetratricopeptide (TPR) repeat protein
VDGEKIAKERLARFPLSGFLQEELGKPNILHLASDPYRVLGVASEYARLGLYRRAVEVLSRDYPSPEADQSEPGAVTPQKNPLIVYFRGYCREKLGESGINDYLQASRLSSINIFPNTIEDQQALKAAIRANENDATAHYLLGTWYFARARTEEAIGEWKKARKLNPQIPVLEASLGLALLHVKRDFAGALNVFAEGIKNDPSNAVNYSGSVSAMAVLGKPAAERVGALELYPDLSRMPTSLVYELALNRAEEGNYKGAIDLFQNRFFGSEEGGTNVRQVWVEVKLQEAIGLARTGHCDEALGAAKTLGSPVPGLAFTQDGLKPLLNSARANYLLGEVSSTCGQKEEGNRRYRLSAQANDTSDVVWAWASAKKQGSYDPALWQKRLSEALSQAESNRLSSSNQSWWGYSVGVLQMALGHEVQGKASLRESLLLPDNRMTYHFSRLAMEGATPR